MNSNANTRQVTERFRRSARAMLTPFTFLPGRGVWYVTNSRTFQTYDVTATSCSCPDAERRPEYRCKHRIALRLHRNALKAKVAEFERIFG